MLLREQRLHATKGIHASYSHEIFVVYSFLEEFNEELAESLRSLAEIESDKPVVVRQQQHVACLALLYLFTLLSNKFPETK